MNTYKITITGKDPVVTEAESVDSAIAIAQLMLGIEQISGDVETVEVEINPRDI